jgi:hypothetical protein
VGTFTIGASMSPWVQEGPVAPYIVGSEPWDATVGGGVAAGGSRRWLCLRPQADSGGCAGARVLGCSLRAPTYGSTCDSLPRYGLRARVPAGRCAACLYEYSCTAWWAGGTRTSES